MNQELIDKFLDKKNVFAVVGASRNRQKYGYQVYVDLKKAGYKVYPVNPNAQEISGDRCYSNVENLPTNPDVVNVVVPSKVAELIAETCRKLGIKKVWMQPGSESETAIKFCDDHGIDVVHGVCVMIERKSRT